MNTGYIINTSKKNNKSIKVKYCSTFWRKFVGLMFRKELSKDEGILLVEKSESKANTAIHMFFMNFDIAAIWIDRNFKVIDVKIARSWRPLYSSKIPAQYVLEAHPSCLMDFQIGDQLSFNYD
jgi:uncharacterized protein